MAEEDFKRKLDAKDSKVLRGIVASCPIISLIIEGIKKLNK